MSELWAGARGLPGKGGLSLEGEVSASLCTAFFVWTPSSLREGFTFWSKRLFVSTRVVVTVTHPQETDS